MDILFLQCKKAYKGFQVNEIYRIDFKGVDAWRIKNTWIPLRYVRSHFIPVTERN